MSDVHIINISAGRIVIATLRGSSYRLPVVCSLLDWSQHYRLDDNMTRFVVGGIRKIDRYLAHIIIIVAYYYEYIPKPQLSKLISKQNTTVT